MLVCMPCDICVQWHVYVTDVFTAQFWRYNTNQFIFKYLAIASPSVCFEMVLTLTHREVHFINGLLALFIITNWMWLLKGQCMPIWYPNWKMDQWRLHSKQDQKCYPLSHHNNGPCTCINLQVFLSIYRALAPAEWPARLTTSLLFDSSEELLDGS